MNGSQRLRHAATRSAAALAGALALLAAACDGARQNVAWEPLPAIAPGTPYGQGVSALYAAEAGGTLLAAGGANFPERPAAEGGAKRFYDEIWLLRPGADAWLAAGRLPRPAAYGATYGLGDGMIAAGGANAEGTLDAVWRLRPEGAGVRIDTLPALPAAVEQAAAARDEKRLYLAGGLTDGVPSTAVYACDAADDALVWHLVARLPRPMVQPVAAAYEGRLYVWGGYDPAAREALGGGYRLDTATGSWQPIDGVPDGGTLTGAAAATLPSGQLVVAGGVDRAVFTAALRLRPVETAEYLRQPAEAYRFRRTLWLFDPATERWRPIAESPPTARAGAALVTAHDGLALLGGELKPGIRTPEHLRTDLPPTSAPD